MPTADAFRFQNDIKGAELEIFEALGHNPMEEDPKATAAAVAAFIKPIPPRPAPPPEPPTDQTVPSVGRAGEGLAGDVHPVARHGLPDRRTSAGA